MTSRSPRPDPQPDPSPASQPPVERGELLGYSLIGVLAVLMVLTLRAEGAAKSVTMGIYLIVLGLMFLASVFYSHKTFLLRGLAWFCVKLSYPSSPKMAYFYAAVMVAMGGVSVLSGLGVV